jgi:methylthioribose-1-phosphate isomerase
MSFTPLKPGDGCVSILDQTLLPNLEEWVDLRDLESCARAIEVMQVRGAPLIGITAAFGVALASAVAETQGEDRWMASMEEAIRRLSRTRPTAVNLFWALNRMKSVVLNGAKDSPLARTRRLWQEALAIWVEDRRMCEAMGEHGAQLVRPGEGLMTHCNAGALATGGYGTALGVIRSAVARHAGIRVYARETRPRLQGARLTAWELSQDGIPVTVLADSAAAHLMKLGKIQRVFVGADRIAANGDTANKIGTYDLAILCRYHGIPFHVVAPYSTVDLSLASGSEIPIEEREAGEVSVVNGERLVPEGVAIWNPAFDVTPNDLVDSIVTEAGVALPPYNVSLPMFLGGQAR